MATLLGFRFMAARGVFKKKNDFSFETAPGVVVTGKLKDQVVQITGFREVYKTDQPCVSYRLPDARLLTSQAPFAEIDDVTINRLPKKCPQPRKVIALPCLPKLP